jgi:glycosyltransferase involved in cell wall biosynthesis
MRIAVLHHHEDFSNDYAAYISALLDDTAEENAYSIKDYEQLLRFREPLKGDNVLLHIIIPATKKFALRRWYNTKLPRIVRKYGIEKVLCSYCICTASKAEQILLFPDKELFSPGKKILLWQQYAEKNLQKSFDKAVTILTYSNATENRLQSAFNIQKEKLLLQPFTVDEIFKPMEWHEKLYIKSRFAENKEFFVAVLPDDDQKIFTDLLKAFSKFKKWQQSNMELLLLPKEESFSSAIGKKLDLYKYRDDVKLINDADTKETSNIIATAYAMLHYPLKDSDLWPVAAALQCATPVIGFHHESINEYCGDAALLATEIIFEAFGDQLILLYKDENLRNKMSEAALEKAKQYNRKEYAQNLWQLLNRA